MTGEPELFRACREGLALSAAEMAAALHVGSGRTVRKWEAGEREVPGPVWVALRYMLRETPCGSSGAAYDLAARISEMLAERHAA